MTTQRKRNRFLAPVARTVAFAGIVARLNAQASGPAAAVHRYVLLGARDTITTEQFVHEGGGITGHASRTDIGYRMTTDASGKIVTVCLQEPVHDDSTHAGMIHVVGEIRPPRVLLKRTEPGEERTLNARSTLPAGLMVPLVLASLENLVRGAPPRVGDSTRVLVANFRYADTTTAVLSRISADSVRLLWPDGSYQRLKVSSQGEMLGGTFVPHAMANGRILNWQVIRLPDAPRDTFQFKAPVCEPPRGLDR